MSHNKRNRNNEKKVNNDQLGENVYPEYTQNPNSTQNTEDEFEASPNSDCPCSSCGEET